MSDFTIDFTERKRTYSHEAFLTVSNDFLDSETPIILYVQVRDTAGQITDRDIVTVSSFLGRIRVECAKP